MDFNAGLTDTIMMIRPVAFGYNEQTAVNNFYQKNNPDESPEAIQAKALAEFDALVEKLKKAGLRVIIFEDTLEPHTPDSIFPNNWISFHEGGGLIRYPMYAENRRLERRSEIVSQLQDEHRFKLWSITDYIYAEREGKFLEGTGSMVLDRKNKIVYASLSERTNKDLVNDFGKDMGYEVITFYAYQPVGEEWLPIYHTNVVMAMAEELVVICLEAVTDREEQFRLLGSFRRTGKKVVKISLKQKQAFAGNMLQLKNKEGQKFMVMSETAFKSLNQEQIQQIETENQIIYSDLNTIETLGGGSARCMIAEIFLPTKHPDEF
ncbi:MAG: amidinotransferase [Bernardetiaceae bacterium]|nr:amidinotransferase [Bernardetiaceae bacterium]